MVRVLQGLQKDRGGPKRLFCDNGSEFPSQVLDLWAYQNGVKIDFSRPGKPTDNGHIESFNWNFPGRMSEHALVHNAGRSQADHRGLAEGVQ